MKRPTIVKLAIAISVIMVLAMWLRHELLIDSCLDRGGRWNSELSACEGATER
jgi:hypothetical protein